MAAPKDNKYLSQYYEVDADGCWIWHFGVSGNGYGNYGNKGAHRVFYEIFKGPIEHKMQIDHLCRKKACVNPEHLEQVTAQENILRMLPYRMANMGGLFHSIKTHCPRGHEYNEENTYNGTRKNGLKYRACRACRRKS